MVFQAADYALCALAVAAAVTGLFRGFSGTLAFAAASAAAVAAGSLGWAWSPRVAAAIWARSGIVLVVSLLAFGIVRLVVKKLVNGLLSQPSDALLGALMGAALAGAAVVAWAWIGLFTEYSALVRVVAEYVR